MISSPSQPGTCISRAGRAALQSAAAIAVVISNSARGPIGHQGPGVYAHPRAAVWPGPSRRRSRRPPLGAPQENSRWRCWDRRAEPACETIDLVGLGGPTHCRDSALSALRRVLTVVFAAVVIGVGRSQLLRFGFEGTGVAGLWYTLAALFALLLLVIARMRLRMRAGFQSGCADNCLPCPPTATPADLRTIYKNRGSCSPARPWPARRRSTAVHAPQSASASRPCCRLCLHEGEDIPAV